MSLSMNDKLQLDTNKYLTWFCLLLFHVLYACWYIMLPLPLCSSQLQKILVTTNYAIVHLLLLFTVSFSGRLNF